MTKGVCGYVGMQLRWLVNHTDCGGELSGSDGSGDKQCSGGGGGVVDRRGGNKD